MSSLCPSINFLPKEMIERKKCKEKKREEIFIGISQPAE